MPTRNFAIRLDVKGEAAVRKALQSLGKDGQRALRQIEKGGPKASKGLIAVSRASQTLQGSLSGVAARAGPFGAALGALGPGGLAAAAGLGALVLGLRALLRNVPEAIDFADTIAKTADAVGISTDALQEYRFAADLAGVSSDGLDKALKFLTKSVGELRTRVSSELSTALKDYDKELLNNIKNAKDQEEVFVLVIRAIEKETDATKRGALAKAAFGRAGLDMVNIANGEAGAFERATQEARDLGTVLGEDLIRQTVASKDELTRLQKQIDKDLTESLLRLQGTLITLKGAWRDMIGLVADLNDLVVDSKSGWQGLFAILGLAEFPVADLRQVRDTIGEIKDEITDLDAEIAKLSEIDPGSSIRDKLRNETLLKDAIKERLELAQKLAAFTARESFLVGPPPGSDPNKPETDTDTETGPAPNATTPARRGRQPELASLQAFMLALEAETDLLRLSADVREQEVAVRRAQTIAMREGNLLTEAQIGQIKQEVADRLTLKKILRDELKAQRAKQALEREAEGLLAGVANETERLAKLQERLNLLVKQKIITDTEANEVLRRTKERYADATSAAEKMARHLEGVAETAIRGNIESWEDLGRVAINVLQDILIEALRTEKGLSGIGSSGGGGGLGGILGSVFGPILNLFGGAPLIGAGSAGASAALLPLGPSFAHGGSFMVGGVGGTDSQPILFKATPRERVTVETPAQQRARGGITIINRIDARGADAGVEERIRQVLREEEPAIIARSVATVQDARRRDPGFFGG